MRSLLARYGPAGLLVAAALARAWTLRWVCDDAFISFRYARNLARGLGLVYNAGEYVEGYTNFLWTLLLALPELLGLDSVSFSISLGVLLFAGTLFYALRFNPPGNLHIPLAAGCFGMMYHAQVYATSGLETALFCFLITSGAFYLKHGRTSPGLLLMGASAMTRPDGVLFAGAAVLYVFVADRQPHRARALLGTVRAALPVLGMGVAFVLWKLHYYGDVLPNTYYAKSGYGSDYRSGATYVGSFLATYYALAGALIAASVVGLRLVRQNRTVEVRPELLLLGLPAVLSILYYVRVGGGFMFGRFLIPSALALWILVETIFARGLPLRAYQAAAGILILMTVLRFDIYEGRKLPVYAGITEENKVYRLRDIRRAGELLRSWAPTFRGKQIRIAIVGSQAFMAYYLEAPLVIEASTGLTDRFLARRTANPSAIVGHRKQAPLSYLERRGVHLLMNGLALRGPPSTRMLHPLGEARIITPDSTVQRALLALPGFRMATRPR